MNVIMDAIRQLSSLQPEQVPHLPAPVMPDVSSVAQLARLTHGKPERFNESVDQLRIDNEELENAQHKARELIGACIRDLIGVGLKLLTRAAPVALGLLVPNPVTKAAVLAMLRTMALQALMEGIQRIQRLIAELGTLAAPLLVIAARSVKSSFGAHARRQQKRLAADHRRQAIPAKAVSAPPQPAASGSSVGVGSSSGSPGAGRAAVQAALSQVGQPYVWGGTGQYGFDCSGLTQWAWRQAGVELPRLAQDQTVGRQVAAAELQPGDLAVWDGHVAMYAGDGKLVEAGSPVSPCLWARGVDQLFRATRVRV